MYTHVIYRFYIPDNFVNKKSLSLLAGRAVASGLYSKQVDSNGINILYYMFGGKIP